MTCNDNFSDSGRYKKERHTMTQWDYRTNILRQTLHVGMGGFKTNLIRLSKIRGKYIKEKS